MEEQTRVTEHISAEGAREAFSEPRTQAKSCGIGETGSQRQGRDEVDGPPHITSLQGRLTLIPLSAHGEMPGRAGAAQGKVHMTTVPMTKWIQLEVPSPCSREAGMSVPITQMLVSMPTDIKSCFWTASSGCNPICPRMGRCCTRVFPGTGLPSPLSRKMMLGGRGAVP